MHVGTCLLVRKCIGTAEALWQLHRPKNLPKEIYWKGGRAGRESERKGSSFLFTCGLAHKSTNLNMAGALLNLPCVKSLTWAFPSQNHNHAMSQVHEMDSPLVYFPLSSNDFSFSVRRPEPRGLKQLVRAE